MNILGENDVANTLVQMIWVYYLIVQMHVILKWDGMHCVFNVNMFEMFIERVNERVDVVIDWFIPTTNVWWLAWWYDAYT
jgi:hypothetical protein